MGVTVPVSLPDTVDLGEALSPDAPTELVTLAVTTLLVEERYAEVRGVVESLLSRARGPHRCGANACSAWS